MKEALVTLDQIEYKDLSKILSSWSFSSLPDAQDGHRQAFALFLGNDPVAFAVTSPLLTMKEADIAPYFEEQVVECLMLRARKGHMQYLRVMLRLWREVCVPMWDEWMVYAAISHPANAGAYEGIFKTDGWKNLRKGSGTPVWCWPYLEFKNSSPQKMSEKPPGSIFVV